MAVEAAAMRRAQAPSRGCSGWESIIYRLPPGAWPSVTVTDVFEPFR
jgi:hypothetical protein